MAYNMLYETYVGADDYSLSLKHHGIKGQKWGVRRFQNADGSLTGAGRKRYGVDGGGLKEKAIRVYNTAKEKVGKATDYYKEKKAKRAEAERAKAIEDGDAKTLLKYADTMSTNELRDAINRANTMKQLKDLADGGNRKSTMERIQNVATKMANFGNAIANAKGAYDRLQKAFTPEDNTDPVEKARNDAYEKTVNADAIKVMNKARDQAKAAGASSKDQELAAYVARQKHYEAVDYAKKRTAELNEARAKAEATIKRQNTMKKVKDLPGKTQSSFYKILDGGEWVTNKDGNSEWRQTKVSDLFKKK